jgi:hypothetical protein
VRRKAQVAALLESWHILWPGDELPRVKDVEWWLHLIGKACQGFNVGMECVSLIMHLLDIDDVAHSTDATTHKALLDGKLAAALFEPWPGTEDDEAEGDQDTLPDGGPFFPVDPSL